MTFYNRNGTLYVRINDKRVSTKLKDTAQNRRLVKNRYKHDEFFEKFNCNKDVPKFIDMCDEILETKDIKNTTYIAYRSVMRCKLIPYFRNMLVSEIRPKHILELYNTFVGKAQIGIAIAIMRPAFKMAIVKEYIVTTPLVVDKPKFKSTYEVKPFSFDEIDLILKNTENPTIRNLLGVMFFTGVRVGEAIGLKWSDIDFDNYEISINRTITHGFIQTPKTKSSLRVIDMLPQTEKFLRDQQLKTGLGEFIFTKDRKYFRGSPTLKPYWEKALKKSNIEYRNIYQTRHTFASNMLSNSEDIMWVSQMLGHKSANVTLDKYGRYIKRKRERKFTFLDTKSTQCG